MNWPALLCPYCKRYDWCPTRHRPVWVGALAHHPECPTIGGKGQRGARIVGASDVVTPLLPKTGSDVIALKAQYDPLFDNELTALTDLESVAILNSDGLPFPQSANRRTAVTNLFNAYNKTYGAWKGYMTAPFNAGLTGVATDQYNQGLTFITQLQDFDTQTVALGGKHVGPKIELPPEGKPSLSLDLSGLTILAGVVLGGIVLMNVTKK